ncbi:MAG: hypothetical protein V7751_13220 [Pseudoalteromonas distincta]|jgi:hypothetical protein|tara:strand:+ start:3212 stop:3361 length:150 start_codon:yes stop_codon:yes gene_type:complete
MDEVRQPLAEKLRATGRPALVEIASRLGNGEVSNVMHSFKRWNWGTALT